MGDERFLFNVFKRFLEIFITFFTLFNVFNFFSERFFTSMDKTNCLVFRTHAIGYVICYDFNQVVDFPALYLGVRAPSADVKVAHRDADNLLCKLTNVSVSPFCRW